MKRTIIILISAFNLDNLKEVDAYHTRYKIIEEKFHNILTDVFEVDIIELPKARKEIENGTFKGFGNLEKWVEFFINPFKRSDSEMEEMNEELKKAYEEVKRLNANEVERDIAERRYLDLLSLEYAKNYEKNLGKEEREKEIAKKMKEKKMDIEMIIEITGLTKEEIEKL